MKEEVTSGALWGGGGEDVAGRNTFSHQSKRNSSDGDDCRKMELLDFYSETF